jgi:hypothetical protein
MMKPFTPIAVVLLAFTPLQIGRALGGSSSERLSGL